MKHILYNILPLLIFGLSCATPKHYTVSNQVHPQLYKFDSSSVKSENMENMLSPYRNKMKKDMDAVIGSTEIPLTKAQPECTMGNFMVDAQMERAQQIDNKVVASIMNYGGIRLQYLSKGEITRGRIYELMPFDNMLVIIELNGETLKKFCQLMAQKGGWPVAGLSYQIKDKSAINIKIAGNTINDNIVYKVALSDYIANGGDDCDFLLDQKRQPTGLFVRDILIEKLEKLKSEGKALNPQLENRVTDAE